MDMYQDDGIHRLAAAALCRAIKDMCGRDEAYREEAYLFFRTPTAAVWGEVVGLDEETLRETALEIRMRKWRFSERKVKRLFREIA